MKVPTQILSKRAVLLVKHNTMIQFIFPLDLEYFYLDPKWHAILQLFLKLNLQNISFNFNSSLDFSFFDVILKYN